MNDRIEQRLRSARDASSGGRLAVAAPRVFAADALRPFLCDAALEVHARSIELWGAARAVTMVGRSPVFETFVENLAKLAHYRECVLITGESGAGKEFVAQAVHLLGRDCATPFVSVSCPQYQDGQLAVSELFGHAKGSFTGAIAHHDGAFVQANHGTLFLDEVADLPPAGQALLLRTLATGECRPIGAVSGCHVDVRVISATNRPLNAMMSSGHFRHDLFFRLWHFHAPVPALRERGDDWRLMLDYWMQVMEQRHGVRKRIAPSAERLLASHTWPGNVRQLLATVSTGYALSSSDRIEEGDIEPHLRGVAASVAAVPAEVPAAHACTFDGVTGGGGDFWSTVHRDFMRRDLNRDQVKTFVAEGLARAGGQYRQLLELLRLPERDYQRFMDFLRHHGLKPGVD